MKALTKAVIISAIFTLLVLTAYGQDKKGFGFSQVQVDNSGNTQLNVFAQRKLVRKCGVFVWILVSPDYQEAYAGPTCTINKHLAVSVGVGVESPGKLRVGGSVWAGNSKIENFTAWEALGSGTWYKTTTKVPFTKKKNIQGGVIAQTGKGVGAHGEYTFGKKPVEVSTDLFFGNHSPILVVSVKYKFGF